MARPRPRRIAPINKPDWGEELDPALDLGFPVELAVDGLPVAVAVPEL